MGLLSRFFRSSEVLGIARETLDFARESAQATHPNEYMGLLRGTQASRLDIDRDGVIITDILVIPGTTSNSVSATMKANQVPNNVKSMGSIHSHPSGVIRPSDADLQTFGRGSIHIILGAPYRLTDWKAFDSKGEERNLDIINVQLPDPDEFFHFSQAEIDKELQR